MVVNEEDLALHWKWNSALDFLAAWDDNSRARGGNTMTETSGSFTGRTRMLHTVSLADIPGHELQTVEVTGTHSSSDSIWNNAHVTYWGISDLVAH
jgi:hypothetical protein